MSKSKFLLFVVFCTFFSITASAQSAEALLEQADRYWTTDRHSEAAECWRRAAELGNVEAQDRYAECLYRGDGVEQNYTTAIMWYEIAIKQHNMNAAYHLGNCYYNGFNGITDYKTAISYYSFAAKNGIEDAQKKLDFINPEAVSIGIGTRTWGFMYHNQIVIPFKYDDAHDFQNGLAAVKKRGWEIRDGAKWGFINKEDKTIIPFDYDDAHDYQNGLAAVKKNDKWGYIDTKNNIIIPFEYEEIRDIQYSNEGLAAAKKNGKWGIIDSNNRILKPFIYNEYEELGVPNQLINSIGNFLHEIKIFLLVDKEPEFRGGKDALKMFIDNNLTYPQKAYQNNISGIVYVSFVVEPNGRLSFIHVLHDIGGGCGDEAVRIIKSMPPWHPGIKDGQKVCTRCIIPVAFNLSR